jgi:toxin ParE1/3/4
MTRSFRITPRAAQDLRNIARFTVQTWGKKQRDTYLRAIDRRFSWLAANPHLGKARPEINQGYYSYPQGSHVIFYLVREGGIDIIGVPHQRMERMGFAALYPSYDDD